MTSKRSNAARWCSLPAGSARPPQVADLAALPIEDYDLDLRECRPGDCKVRLGANEIARFQRDVDWRAADWRERSRAVWRDTLTGYIAAYSRDGRNALPTFVNKPEPLPVPAELSLLVDRFAFVGAYSPAFLAYLREFGSAATGRDERRSATGPRRTSA